MSDAPADPLYREHRIWRRPGEERALRYVLFENLTTGLFAVVSCDVFPTTSETAAWLEQHIGEALADDEVGLEGGWHATLQEAIDAFDHDFAEALEGEVEDDVVGDEDDDDFEDDEYEGDDEDDEDLDGDDEYVDEPEPKK